MHTITWKDFIGTPVSGRYILRNLVYSDLRQAEFLAVAMEGDEEPVSIALVEPEPGEVETELAAISRAKQLQHPNLLQVMDGGECVLDGTQMLFIVTEASQGTLAAEPRPDLSVLLGDVLSALDWLHSQNLVYRNLDPETIVRANGHWKLADLSRVHPAGQFGDEESTGRNVPPEAASGWILPAWDIWTIGVLLRDLLGGDAGVLPAPFDAIVLGCLKTDQRQRLSLAAIRELLKPAPAAEPMAEPQFEAPRERVAPSRPPLPVVILAVILILGALLYALLRLNREKASPPASPPPATASSPSESKPALTEERSPTVDQVPRTAPAPAQSIAAPTKPASNAQIGRADYFSDELEGHLTAGGERFSNSAMTAASLQFPLGARLRVTDLKSKRSVTVRVNDRGPARRGFVVTITRRAADELGFVKAGSARVKVEQLK
jgi:rare lipoprotein A